MKARGTAFLRWGKSFFVSEDGPSSGDPTETPEAEQAVNSLSDPAAQIAALQERTQRTLEAGATVGRMGRAIGGESISLASGTAGDIYTAATGVDSGTEEEVGTGGRVLAAAGAIIPGVSGRELRLGKKVLEHGDGLTDTARSVGRIERAVPGSVAHKAARWEEYQARGGTWSYERWSNNYEPNMGRASRANKAADAFHESLGWGRREVTVDVEGVPRRLDIADEATLRGREVKTGYQKATQENLWEVQRDEILREKGWDIHWRFEGRASRQLRDALEKAGIPYTGGT